MSKVSRRTHQLNLLFPLAVAALWWPDHLLAQLWSGNLFEERSQQLLEACSHSSALIQTQAQSEACTQKATSPSQKKNLRHSPPPFRAIEMDRHTPPSPIKGEQLPAGFDDLMHHNTSYPREAHALDSVQAQSQPPSRYGTPVPLSQHSQGYDAGMQYQQRGMGAPLVRQIVASCE
jgi:hypothetical protein